MSSVVAEDRPILDAALASVLADRTVDDVELRLRLGGGLAGPAMAAPDDERVCMLSLRALTDAASVVTGAVGCLTDVTDRVQLRHELEDEGVGRQAHLLPESCGIARATRADDGDAKPWPAKETALIFIDLDRFKSVNDRFGHAAGDRLLAAAAELLRGTVRDCDSIGRFGGDEFIVICPRVESSAQAVTIAERVEAAMTATMRSAQASSSCGPASAWPGAPKPLDADTFIAQADSAMYQSKRRRGKGVTLFTPATDGASPDAVAPAPNPPHRLALRISLQAVPPSVAREPPACAQRSDEASPSASPATRCIPPRAKGRRARRRRQGRRPASRLRR